MIEFEDIYKHYFSDVYRYTLSLCRNKEVAEEITQETFFKALKSIHNFREECKLRVWLCQIAKKTYFSLLDKKSIEEVYNVETPYDSFEQKLINKETALEIHRAIHFMEEPFKEVVSLRIFGELSFFQIGELFGKTESWARVTFHRAKLKLKEDLK